MSDPLADLRFRASREHELVPYDRLSAAERLALGALEGDPGFYGILRPHPGSGYNIKQVGPDTALLFLTLADPDPIPSYVRASLGESWSRTVTQLVLDGVLEVEIEGRFVSGPDAYPVLCGPPPAPSASGTLEQLSRRALLHAQELAKQMPSLEAAELAGRLYVYNQVPLSPAWRRRLPDRPAVRRFLGLNGSRRLPGAPGSPWKEVESDRTSWLSWHAPEFRGFRGADARCWKLYVSPRPEDLPRVFAACADRLHDVDAVSFKVGGDATGILRPDKMVVYFREKQHLLDAARALGSALSAVAPQGVPFTADVEGGSGLLSWGVDLPPAGDEPSWIPRESWRVRLTHRLAVALAAAVRRDPPPEEPWRFALGRIRFEGVDPATWTPVDGDILGRDGALR